MESCWKFLPNEILHNVLKFSGKVVYIDGKYVNIKPINIKNYDIVNEFLLRKAEFMEIEENSDGEFSFQFNSCIDDGSSQRGSIHGLHCDTGLENQLEWAHWVLREDRVNCQIINKRYEIIY